MKSFFQRISVLALAGLLLCPLAYAQFDTATVLGTVRDTTGAVIPGVTVTLTKIDTGIATTAVTDGSGNYQFFTVKIGFYKVTGELSGFSTAVADQINVTINARQRVDLVMKVGSISETVEVSGAAQLVEADSSDRGQVIQEKQIQGLPLNGRNYADLSLLSPGVRRSDKNEERDGSYNVHGLRSTFNNYMLDGVDNSSYGTSNQGFSNQVVQLPPDAVAEFKVQTNNFSAEYGRAAGAMINASLKSGTNEFRGTLWEFHRNDNLNARGFFGGATKPFLIRNQFGWTFGGPIIKKKTFFFTDYEGYRERRATPNFATVPLQSVRDGNLGIPVRNPFTNEVFSNGIIPTGQISPFAKKVWAGLVAPNLSGTSNNYRTDLAVNNNTDKGDLKIDHQFADRLNAFFRISHRKMNIFDAPPIPGPSGGEGNGWVRVLNQAIAGGATFNPSPTSLLEIRFGASRTKAGKEPVNVGSPSMVDAYGIVGLPKGNPRIQGGLTNIAMSGFSALGQQSTNPQWQDPTVYNPKVNYAWIQGKHSMKVGYEYQYMHVKIQDVNPLNGSLAYGGQYSRPAGAASNNLYNVADFMFGAPSQLRLVNYFEADMQQRMHFAYFQDDWKVLPNLTLNLGVRYEFATPMWDKENRLTNFDPRTNSILTAKNGSLEDRALVAPDKNNWAPRLGFAWSFMPKTVLRGGYGVSYVHFNRAGAGNILAINGPQVVGALLVQSITDSGFRTMRGDGLGNDGFPAGFTAPDKFNPLAAMFSYMPRDTRTSYVQSWHLTVQREIVKDTMLDVAYVGNMGLKILIFGDTNQARPNAPGKIESLQSRRPIANFSAISTAFNRAASNYHALQVKFQHTSKYGLSLLNSFTYSKAIDNSTGALENPNGARSSPQNIYDLKAERGLSVYDQTLNNVTSFVWNIPIGKGNRFLTDLHPVLDGIFGGWKLSAINSMTSGAPVQLLFVPSTNFQVTAILGSWLGGNSPRPNITGPPKLPDGKRTVDEYLDRNAVQIPTDPSQPFGNAGRSIVRSDSFYQLDMGISKDFRLPRESMKVEFRAEFFNALNKTNLRAPQGSRSSAAFGSVRSTFPPREIQFGLKLHF